MASTSSAAAAAARLVLGLVVVALVIAGCRPASTVAAEPFAGAYFGSGSGAGLEQVRALAKRFAQLHPGVDFRLDDAGSETGIALVGQNQIDFGYVSRDPTPAESAKIALTPLIGTGTAVAVNPANPVTGLTRRQISEIFAGVITDWGAVGGLAGHPIRLVVRESESATRATFDGYFFPGTKPTYSNAINVVESKEAYAQIRAQKDSIGMVTLQTSTQNDTTMRLLTLDGVAATTANVGNGTYPIRRPVYFFTAADPTKVKPAVRAFVEFLKGPEGAQILSAF